MRVGGGKAREMEDDKVKTKEKIEGDQMGGGRVNKTKQLVKDISDDG